jgi:hypothetical protein
MISDVSISSAEKAQDYYNKLSAFQKKRMLVAFEKLKNEERKKIFDEYKLSPQANSLFYWNDPWFYIFLMTTNEGVLSNTWTLPSASVVSNASLSSSHGLNGHNDNGHILMVAILIGSAIISAIVSAAYAIKKTFNAIRNLAKGEKPLKSIFRLSGIAVGAAVGATIGSAVPVIGTAVGAVFGSILMATIAAGIGAFATKYIAKGIAAIVSILAPTHDESDGRKVSLTNPGKYHLSKKQFESLQAQWGNTNKQTSYTAIYDLMNELRKAKNKFPVSGSIPGTNARDKKDIINEYIRGLKDGRLLVDQAGDVYQMANNESTLFMSKQERNYLDDETVELFPQLK